MANDTKDLMNGQAALAMDDALEGARRATGNASSIAPPDTEVVTTARRRQFSSAELQAGKHTIVFDYKTGEPGLGKGGTGVLRVDGKEVARNSMEHSTAITFPEDEIVDIGQDTRTGVAMVEYRYDPPFKFTGTINKLTFQLEPNQVTAEEREDMNKAVAKARD